MKDLIQQNSTIEVKKFKPTSKMVKWLDIAMKLGYGTSITEISKQAKVDRTNWYKWIEQDAFVEWWDSVWKKYIRTQRHKLDLIGLKQAETNHDWWRDMKKVVGEPIPDDPTAPTSAFQNNNNIIMSPEQIKRLLGE